MCGLGSRNLTSGFPFSNFRYSERVKGEEGKRNKACKAGKRTWVMEESPFFCYPHLPTYSRVLLSPVRSDSHIFHISCCPRNPEFLGSEFIHRY